MLLYENPRFFNQIIRYHGWFLLVNAEYTDYHRRADSRISDNADAAVIPGEVHRKERRKSFSAPPVNVVHPL